MSCELCAYMKLLLIFLSIVMTFTVETKSSVKAEGTFPYGMEANYACTYQKGDVREGDTATLALRGLETIQLEQVKLYLRSNKSSGAGVITMIADGNQLYKKEGTYQEWFGAYDNTKHQPIGWTGKKTLTDGTLEISIIGKTNSLHIEKYEVSYVQAETQAYSVTLITDKEQEVLKETAPESGVLLPKRDDRDGWYFVGWAQSDIQETTEEQPGILSAGERYYPKKDITLWAVWTDVQQPSWARQTEPESGFYVLEFGNYILTGSVENGLMTLASNDQVYTDDIYYLDFNTADTSCTIRNYVTGSYVGYNQGKTELSRTASPWRYMVLPDSTWLFIAQEADNKVCILFQKNTEAVAWLHSYTLGDNPHGVWLLYRVPDPEQIPHWWSHPWPLAVQVVNCEKQDRIIRFGIYEIHVKDGKKYLRLR